MIHFFSGKISEFLALLTRFLLLDKIPTKIFFGGQRNFFWGAKLFVAEFRRF